jgi:formylglycine-generating enzyme required for sulfatase activity
MKTFPAACLAALLALSAGSLAQTSAPATATAPSAPGVPDVVLSRLRSQYLSEDDRTPGVSEADKIRRYEAMLREGAWAEKQYPRAADLYRVREWMLAAAKGLATLEGTAEARRQLMEIIERQAADAAAPAEARLPADLMLWRVRLDQFGDSPAETAEEIELFLERYARTPAAARSLMGAVELSKATGAKYITQRCLRQLGRHFSEPGVAEYLEAAGLNPHHGRLMPARLTKLDGSTMSLPRDTMGKVTVLHFWSMERSGLAARRGPAGAMKLSYEKLRSLGVEFVGVNLDTDVAKVRRFVEAEGMSWPQSCSGLGANDPVFRRYRVPVLPAWWVIGPDGRAISNSYTQGDHSLEWTAWGGGFAGHVENVLSQMQEAIARAPYYRSGEFLLDVPEVFPQTAPAAGDIPAEELAAIREKLFLPPSLGLWPKEKAGLLRQALQAARAAEREHPAAANLALARNWAMVAAKWLAHETGDAACAAEAKKIADAIVASGAAGRDRLLAEYVRLSADLAAAGEAAKAAERIGALRRAYAGGAVEWAADILGAMLAIECGEEETRIAVVRDLYEHAAAQPKVRGFLRDYCNAHVDARSSYFQYWPIGLMAAGGEPPATDPFVPRTVLPLLRGGTLRLGEDTRGKAVVIQFWSAAHPPLSMATICGNRKRPGELVADADVISVAVNLDTARADAERFAVGDDASVKWVQVFSGKGHDDPLARELDVYHLPRTVVLDTQGAIFRWGCPVLLGESAQQAARPPPVAPASLPPPPPGDVTTAPADALPKTLSLELGGRLAMELALVPAADFRMGPYGEGRRYGDDTRLRVVTITRPFYMGVCPVTRAQFAAFVKDSGYTSEAQREGWAYTWTGGRWTKTDGACWEKPGFEQDGNHPAVCVTYADATEFCKWLARRSGRAVRVPTEAQWELACRGRTTSVYLWGNDPNGGEGWCNGADASRREMGKTCPAEAGRPLFAWNDGYAFTSPVGRFKPNENGLYDMLGNVWEWTSDWFDQGFEYSHQWRQVRYDPAGPSSGSYKAVRGGSWQGGPQDCRSAARRPEPPAAKMNMVGFRVCADAPR